MGKNICQLFQLTEMNKARHQEVIERVSARCLQLFADHKIYKLPQEYYYSHLPLCVIDAVFSIGVRYSSVRNTVCRFCDYYGIQEFKAKEIVTTSEALSWMQGVTADYLREAVFNNRQRTSPTNGIPKAEAVVQVMEILKKFHIETKEDVNKLTNPDIEHEVRKIPGQTSGISFKYFLMLSGIEGYVKPDRMIIKFIETSANVKIKQEDCQPILQSALTRLSQQGFNLTLRELDNLIWNYQRALKK
jgi:hypothetical protein